MKQSQEAILKSVEDLVNSWCERRCFSALKFILQGFPLNSPLTDGWADLLEALENVGAFAGNEISENEKIIINQLIDSINNLVYRK
ncbi:MAG TPA: hypothetical protein VK892_10635 [Pyrinomonadaceae bacterium]|nr:hypothetical protein [Pyrinomonadaceae bacterium]